MFSLIFFLPLIFAVALNIFTIYSAYLNYQKGLLQNDSLADIITNNPTNYVPLSEKAKQYLSEIATEKGIDNRGLQFITCAHFQNCPQDYLTLAGTEKIFISIPDIQTEQLNEYLEKESLTEKEHTILNEIVFFVGHELEHVKVYQSNAFFSCLRLAVKMTIAQATLSTLLFAAIFYATSGVYGMTLLFVYSFMVFTLGYLSQKITSLVTYYEELYCDRHASKDVAILQAGITAMDSEHVIRVTAHILKQNIFASKIIAPFSKTFASAWATHHPHPSVRQHNLQIQIDNLYNK